jgi:hypothetical protein
MTTGVGRRRLLEVFAHAANLVWRAGGLIAKHAAAGWEATVGALSHGERGEEGELWRGERPTPVAHPAPARARLLAMGCGRRARCLPDRDGVRAACPLPSRRFARRRCSS